MKIIQNLQFAKGVGANNTFTVQQTGAPAQTPAPANLNQSVFQQQPQSTQSATTDQNNQPQQTDPVKQFQEAMGNLLQAVMQMMQAFMGMMQGQQGQTADQAANQAAAQTGAPQEVANQAAAQAPAAPTANQAAAPVEQKQPTANQAADDDKKADKADKEKEKNVLTQLIEMLKALFESKNKDEAKKPEEPKANQAAAPTEETGKDKGLLQQLLTILLSALAQIIQALQGEGKDKQNDSTGIQQDAQNEAAKTPKLPAAPKV